MVNRHVRYQTEKDFVSNYCVGSLMQFGWYFHDEGLDIRKICKADSAGSKGRQSGCQELQQFVVSPD
jgi:hypothetical protein